MTIKYKVSPISGCHFLIIYYQKLCKNQTLKHLVKIFQDFKAIFIKWWSRGNHSWLWNQRSCVQIPAVPFLFLSENVDVTGIWTWDLRIQSQLYLPLDHRYWGFVAKKILSVAFLEGGGVMTTPTPTPHPREGKSSVKCEVVNRVKFYKSY